MICYTFHMKTMLKNIIQWTPLLLTQAQRNKDFLSASPGHPVPDFRFLVPPNFLWISVIRLPTKSDNRTEYFVKHLTPIQFFSKYLFCFSHKKDFPNDLMVCGHVIYHFKFIYTPDFSHLHKHNTVHSAHTRSCTHIIFWKNSLRIIFPSNARNLNFATR